MTIAIKPRILLVDDEERILRTLTMLLRMQYQVFATTDGYEALKIMQKEKIHVLISDQRMPTMVGTELLRHARERHPNTIRILLTGYADVDAAVDSVNEGEIFRYINKPWGPKELRDTIADAVAIALKLEQVNIPSFPLPTPAKGINCLVLDEDVSVYETVRDILGDQHHVLWRTTIASALTVLASQSVAVLVTELQVADGDASVMIKTLKQEYPALLTIINTSFKDTQRVAQLINQAQVYRYLPKPLRKGLLAKSLESTLSRYKQLQDLPVLKEVIKVEQSSDVQEKAVSSKIADYLAKIRAKGFGGSKPALA
ncbi:response regulator [Agitococcus lubricus]|uniref:Response regulator receiver domain-containing protein n=1 Tax=Agitococcus lubricus TaxID=1077255 RepID=A0A2T5J1K8_9GAMM|nr:response regulator [Agitococcus lubricus]PTQ90179.1 response regulator receiver domain-containing protein [Agitococcus lubricus]